MVPTTAKIAVKNFWPAIVSLLVFKIFLSRVFHLLADFFNAKNISAPNDFTIIETIIAVIIVAPIIETLIFQFLLQELLIRILTKIRLKSVFSSTLVISSLLFSLTHFGSFLHIIISLPSGLIYGGVYMLAKTKFQSMFLAIITTSIIHMLYNLSEFLIYDNY